MKRHILGYGLTFAAGFLLGMFCFVEEPEDLNKTMGPPVTECKANEDFVCFRVPIDRD